MLSQRRTEWGHRASGPSCVPEQKVMRVAPWITPSRVRLPRIPMIYPQGKPAMSRGQMHTVYSQVHTCQVVICVRLCSTRTKKGPQIINSTHTHMMHTHSWENMQIPLILSVFSATAASVCLQARQTANKRPISRAIHLWGCFAERVDLNGCRLLQEARLGWGEQPEKDANVILRESPPPSTVTNGLDAKQEKGQTYILLFSSTFHTSATTCLTCLDGININAATFCSLLLLSCSFEMFILCFDLFLLTTASQEKLICSNSRRI